MVTIRGGENLEKALSELANKLTKKATLSVGFMEGATYPDGKSVAEVAAYQEFGAPRAGIPPRPFFRTMIENESQQWPALLAAALKATDNDIERALGQLGAVIVGQLQQSIINTNSPALSPLTVMLRGMRSQAQYRDMPFGQLIKEAQSRLDAGKPAYGASTKPLVDSGVMLHAATFRVDNE